MRLGLHCAGAHTTAAVFDRGAIRSVVRRPAGEDGPLAAAEAALHDLASDTALATRAAHVTSITFEASELLNVDPTLPVTLVRVSPRRPLHGHDPFPLPQLGTGRVHNAPHIVHLPGGHNAHGQEIVPLDTTGLLGLSPVEPEAPRFVVSAVGALLNPEHELRTGAALLAEFPGANIAYAHEFHHASFSVRERTAFVNLALRDRAEQIMTALSVAASASFPGARLLVATNSGGSTPLARFAVTPVDSVASLLATEAVGAATLLHAADGTLSFSHGVERFDCELSGGLPAVVPALVSEVFGKLATPAGNVRATQSDPELPAGDRPAPHEFAPDERATLGACGAACLPRVAWFLTLAQVANEADMRRSKQAAEARVHARLVATGMPPESIRTAESLVTATSYGNPGVIVLRIRAVADPDALHRAPRSRP